MENLNPQEIDISYVLDPHQDVVLRALKLRSMLRKHVLKVIFAKKSGELTERVVTLRNDLIPTKEGHTLDVSIKELHQDMSSVYDLEKAGWIKIATPNVREISGTDNRYPNPERV